MEVISIARGPANVLGRLFDRNENVNFRHVMPVPPVLEMQPAANQARSVAHWQADVWGTPSPKQAESWTWDDDILETQIMCVRFRTKARPRIWQPLAALFPGAEFRVCTIDHDHSVLRELYARSGLVFADRVDTDTRILADAPLPLVAAEPQWQF